MAFIPVPNVGEFALNFLYNGQPAVNVFHVLFPSPPNATELEATCGLFRTWWIGELAPEVTNNASLQYITARDLSTQNSVGIIYNTSLPASGRASVAALPSNVTLAVKWGTGLAGRSYRGRTYHVGLGESQVAGNTVDNTALTNYRDAYTALITAIDNAGGQLVVVSKYTNNAPRTTGIATPITSATIEPNVDTQRRRLIS
jgi:hypothetical protein